GIRGFHVTGVQTCALPIYIDPATAAAIGMYRADRAVDDHRVTRVDRNAHLVGNAGQAGRRASPVGDEAADPATLRRRVEEDVLRSEERRVGKEWGYQETRE